MLYSCSEITEYDTLSSWPTVLKNLYSFGPVRSAEEAMLLLSHAIFLETGFYISRFCYGSKPGEYHNAKENNTTSNDSCKSSENAKNKPIACNKEINSSARKVGSSHCVENKSFLTDDDSTDSGHASDESHPISEHKNSIIAQLAGNYEGKYFQCLYGHPTTPNIEVQIRFIIVGSYIVTYGLVQNCKNRIFNSSNVQDHVLQVDEDSFLYCSVKEMYRAYKDRMMLPLLANLQSKAGIKPTFGLSIACDDIKLRIISHLPRRDRAELAKVSAEFKSLISYASKWYPPANPEYEEDEDQSHGCSMAKPRAILRI